MWNGWLVGQPAGWLAGCLAASPRTDQRRSTLLLSLSLFLPRAYITLCACIRTTRVWKMRGLDGGEERRNEGGFRKEEIFQRALPSDRRRGEDGTRNSPFFLPFLVTFRFLWSRERNFNCAVVCLVMRVRAPFFHLVSTGNCWCRGRGGGETSSSFWPLCTLPSRASSYGRRNENSPSPPFVPHLFCVDSTLLGLSPTVVSRAGGFVSLSVHTGRKWTSGSFLATMYSRSIRGSYICVYTYASSLIRTKPAFEVWRYTRCVLLNRNRR